MKLKKQSQLKGKNPSIFISLLSLNRDTWDGTCFFLGSGGGHGELGKHGL